MFTIIFVGLHSKSYFIKYEYDNRVYSISFSHFCIWACFYFIYLFYLSESVHSLHSSVVFLVQHTQSNPQPINNPHARGPTDLVPQYGCGARGGHLAGSEPNRSDARRQAEYEHLRHGADDLRGDGDSKPIGAHAGALEPRAGAVESGAQQGR